MQDRAWRPEKRDLPCIFPVISENVAETGSPETAATAMFSRSEQKAQENRVDRSRSQNAVSHLRGTVTHGVTLPGQRPASFGVRVRRRRPAGPYLQRRGSIYYFRKRLPDVIAKKGAQKFLCLSLRTALLAEAMGRAARLLAIVDREEARLMTDPTYHQIPAEEIALLLTEALRTELARILLEQDTGPIRDDEEIDARIALLEQENLELKRRARRGDFSEVEPKLRKAADALGISLPETIPNDLGRRVVDLVREMQEIETEDARR